MGGSWDHWWLKTPLPGIVWCNCPHMTGLDGLKVEDLTRGRLRGPQAHLRAGRFRARQACRASRTASSSTSRRRLGIRQTRLLEGEYVVTKDDVMERVHFPDTVARGRDYYTPYRAMLPKEVDGLIVAGRHYSATEAAQKMSREIPPCMSMGQSAGVAAALALAGNVPLRRVEPRAICARVRAQGGDPGDRAVRQRQDDGECRVTSRQRTAARRHPGHRLHPGDDGPGRDADARRLRRRRDQDRAAADRRSVAHRRSRTIRPVWSGRSICSLNRNKRSVVLDLRKPEDRAAVLDADRDRRRGREQFPRRRDGAHGLRLRGAEARSTRGSSTRSAPASASTGPYAHKGGQDVLAQAMSRRDGAPLATTSDPLVGLRHDLRRLFGRHAPGAGRAARAAAAGEDRARPAGQRVAAQFDDRGADAGGGRRI